MEQKHKAQKTNKNFILSNITDEMEGSFISYAINVIVSRALPDVRDGLKPVQRRILYSMFKLNINWKSPSKKSARIVGEVIGKYHPHGNESVYQAMVRMAQDFSLRYPLIKGQGNFGSVDGDPPAAMRYTEVKMTHIADEMVRHLSEFNVEFKPNYDGSEKEPICLTSFIPNLIINGSSGIAVGIATSIPPHNLKEVLNALIYLIKNREATIDDLINFIPGPDFPGGADIYKPRSIKKFYSEGKGFVMLRATFLIEKNNKKTKIIFTSIPFKINKSELLIRIDDLVSKKIIKGISNLFDESSRKEVRIAITIADGYNYKIILDQLFKLTNLQINFYYNFVVLVNNKPKLLNLKEILIYFLKHQNKILVSQTRFDVKKTENRNEILAGLFKALNQIDLVIDLIRNSASNKEAQIKLVEKIGLSQKQSAVVLETKLSRLTSLEINKIKKEILVNEQNLKNWNELLNSEEIQNQKMIENLEEIKNKYADNRFCRIIEGLPSKTTDLDLVHDKDFVLILTEKNYVKKLDCDLFKTQHRGGKGVYGINRFKQVVKLIIKANSKDKLFFFTKKGKVFTRDLYEIPSQSINSQGIPINNLIKLEKDDSVCRIMNLPIKKDNNIEKKLFIFLTKKGWVKKIMISKFGIINRNGKIAIKLRNNDTLIGVINISFDDLIAIGSSLGRICIFYASEIKLQNRQTQGLKGINCGNGNATFLSRIEPEKKGFMLFLTDLGYGKKILLNSQKINHRTNKGLVFIKKSLQNKIMISFVCQVISKQITILAATKNGKFIKVAVSEFSSYKNKTALGTKIINLEPNDRLVTATLIN